MQTGADPSPFERAIEHVNHWERPGQLYKTRYREFADTFISELQNRPYRDAILTAGRRLDWHWAGDGWRRPMTDGQILRKAKKILANEHVVEYMKYYFDAIGFTALDGARMLVRHINGDVTKEVLDKTGQVVELKVPPSLAALQTYHGLTLEKQTTKVQVDTRMLVSHQMNTSEPPRMRARVLKDVTPALEGK
jgi:hypothetical protein